MFCHNQHMKLGCILIWSPCIITLSLYMLGLHVFNLLWWLAKFLINNGSVHVVITYLHHDRFHLPTALYCQLASTNDKKVIYWSFSYLVGTLQCWWKVPLFFFSLISNWKCQWYIQMVGCKSQSADLLNSHSLWEVVYILFQARDNNQMTSCPDKKDTFRR